MASSPPPILRRLVHTLIAVLLLMNATAVIFLTTNNSIAFNAVQTSSYDGSDIVEGAVVGEPPPLEPLLPQNSIFNISSTVPQNETADFLIEMDSRQKEVAKACEDGNHQSRAMDSKEQHPYNELYLQREFRLLWCPVYKASSTNWLNYFVKLARVTEARKILVRKRHGGRINEVANEFYPRITNAKELELFDTVNGSTTHFVIVRHPFYRLVSAYRDKLERIIAGKPKNDYYYKLYGWKIVNQYREAAQRRFGREFFSRRNNFGAPLPVRKKGRRTEELPTFWEFVQHVKNTGVDDLDIHWRPASAFCNPCKVRYDYILRFEDLVNEQPLFLNVTGLKRKLGSGIEERNVNRPAGMDDAKVTEVYFQQLDDADLVSLYAIYADDFKMFGYEYARGTLSFPV